LTADAERKKMDISVEQLGELIAQAKAGRVTRENFQQFLANPNGFAVGGFLVSIDYGKSIEEMVSSGRYDWANDAINSRNFQIVGSGTAQVVPELVYLNKVVTSEEVLVHMEANGLRPATLAELLAFGATYPEIQRQYPVVCLGSLWVDRCGYRHVPDLYGGGSERELSLRWYGCGWLESCRFLAVRK